ncbi:MAG: hypothetical protein JWL83_640 [Actinomycetia bacterium]|jgi:hypothetical protein|nr:hypothetical protein [Actinomycetes bacterium]
MARTRILDPTAAPPATDADPGPDAGDLAGRRVGLRFDSAWRSWLWVLDEWEPRFIAAGAQIERWSAGNRIGEGGEQTFAALDTFATDVDLALIGLGN